jgi:predicted RNA-binding Zn-ribbon protein involved in translation (DUF1610 family)
MRLETSPQADISSAPVPPPICPYCGGELSPNTDERSRFECLACGEVQRTDALSSKAIQRQQSHLHSRGIDRLLGAILNPQEAP